MTDTPVLIRTSERRLYKSCRQAWAWQYLDRLRSTSPTRGALRFGDIAHQAMAEWYIPGWRRGTHPAVTFERVFREQEEELGSFSIWADDESVDPLGLGLEMMNNYVAHWGTDDHIEIISPEMPFQVRMKDLKGKWFIYTGILDAVYRNRQTKRLGFLEHKTAVSISVAHLPMDEQAGSYWAVAPSFLTDRGILKPGEDLDVITYNFLRKGKKDDRPRNEDGHYLNKDGTVSKRQPPPLFVRESVWRDAGDRRTLVRRIRAEAYEMDLVRRGKLPVYKNPRASYPDQHCTVCEFREMCEVHETGGDWESIRDLDMETWDPFAAHEELGRPTR